MNFRPPVLLPLLALFGCASPQTVNRTTFTSSSFGPAFAEYAVETSDKDGSKTISRSEWLAAGGTEKSFRVIDSDHDNVLTVDEVRTVSSTDRFFAFAKRTIDTGGNTELTPQAFRSPAGARLFSYPF